MREVREALNHPSLSPEGKMIFPTRGGHISYGVCDIICKMLGSRWEELSETFCCFADPYRDPLNTWIYLWELNEAGRLARIDAVDRFIKVLEAEAENAREK